MQTAPTRACAPAAVVATVLTWFFLDASLALMMVPWWLLLALLAAGVRPGERQVLALLLPGRPAWRGRRSAPRRPVAWSAAAVRQRRELAPWGSRAPPLAAA